MPGHSFTQLQHVAGERLGSSGVHVMHSQQQSWLSTSLACTCWPTDSQLALPAALMFDMPCWTPDSSCDGHKASACRLAEGRQPWSGRDMQPAAELAEHESGVHALDCCPQGLTAAAGTEQGTVALWDLRSSSLSSQVHVLQRLMYLLRGQAASHIQGGQAASQIQGRLAGQKCKAPSLPL